MNVKDLFHSLTRESRNDIAGAAQMIAGEMVECLRREDYPQAREQLAGKLVQAAGLIKWIASQEVRAKRLSRELAAD